MKGGNCLKEHIVDFFSSGEKPLKISKINLKICGVLNNLIRVTDDDEYYFELQGSIFFILRLVANDSIQDTSES